MKEALRRHQILSRERTKLAYERNSLASIRTGFSSFILGLALIKLLDENLIFVIGGWITLLLGVIFVIFGVIYYEKKKWDFLRFFDNKFK